MSSCNIPLLTIQLGEQDDRISTPGDRRQFDDQDGRTRLLHGRHAAGGNAR